MFFGHGKYQANTTTATATAVTNLAFYYFPYLTSLRKRANISTPSFSCAPQKGVCVLDQSFSNLLDYSKVQKARFRKKHMFIWWNARFIVETGTFLLNAAVISLPRYLGNFTNFQ